jgi:hypothetical protein
MSDARREALIAAAAAATAAHFRDAAAGGLESLGAASTAESDRIALGMLE